MGNWVKLREEDKGKRRCRLMIAAVTTFDSPLSSSSASKAVAAAAAAFAVAAAVVNT